MPGGWEWAEGRGLAEGGATDGRRRMVSERRSCSHRVIPRRRGRGMAGRSGFPRVGWFAISLEPRGQLGGEVIYGVIMRNRWSGPTGNPLSRAYSGRVLRRCYHIERGSPEIYGSFSVLQNRLE